MNIHTILGELRAERDRTDQAISALQAVNSTGPRRVGRPPKVARQPRRRSRMSAAGRARIAAAHLRLLPPNVSLPDRVAALRSTMPGTFLCAITS
jgi:hypothetical protein